MLRTVLRRAGACTLAFAALLATLSVVTATPAAADPPQVPRYSCPGPLVVGGTAPGASAPVAALLAANPGRCGERLQALAYYDLRRDTWDPRGRVTLPDGRIAFEYQQYHETRRSAGEAWTRPTTDGTVRVLIGARCVAGKSATRAFSGVRLGTTFSPAFRVSFTNLSFCYNGANAWFRDEPQYRIYIGSSLSPTLQGACAGVSRTAIDPNNANQLSSVFITCNAIFSNRDAAIRMRSDVDTDGNSRFTLPGSLNAGINLGPLGFVATPPVADQIRYFTMRITANGCYTISGVGTGTVQTCF